MSRYPLVPVCNFLAGCVVLLLLPWRLHSSTLNTGICSSIVWISTLSFICAINSIIWKDTIEDAAPVWCEIVIRVIVMGGIALPACSVVVVRRLYLATCCHRVGSQSNCSRVITDLGICFGFPLLINPLLYIVQPYRYMIFEDIGCFIPLVNTPLTYVLVWMWPLLLACISVVYSFLIVRSFVTRRRELNELLSNSDSSVSYNIFNRVFFLVGLETLVGIPLGVLAIYIFAGKDTVYPYVSWEYVHRNFHRVTAFTMAEVNRDAPGNGPLTLLRLSQWINPFSALIFLASFGTSKGLYRYYRDAFWSLASKCGLKKRSVPSPTSNTKSEMSTVVFTTVVIRDVESFQSTDVESDVGKELEIKRDGFENENKQIGSENV